MYKRVLRCLGAAHNTVEEKKAQHINNDTYPICEVWWRMNSQVFQGILQGHLPTLKLNRRHDAKGQ